MSTPLTKPLRRTGAAKREGAGPARAEVRAAGPRHVARIGSNGDLAALAQALGPLQPNTGQSCSEQVLELLHDAIVRARLLPGTPLSEAVVARVLGVSRTPAREALRELAKEQLVRVYPQAATVVAPLSMDALREGCFIRRSLECANIMELVSRVTPTGLRELSAMIKSQRAALAANRPGDFFYLDEAMHGHLFDLAGHRQTWPRIQRIKQHLDRVRWLLQLNPAHAVRNLREHTRIVALLKARDGPGAAAAMYDHINAVNQDVLNLRDRAPENFFEA
jgi:DNA-binding GntR family transcriptional regulator